VALWQASPFWNPGVRVDLRVRRGLDSVQAALPLRYLPQHPRPHARRLLPAPCLSLPRSSPPDGSGGVGGGTGGRRRTAGRLRTWGWRIPPTEMWFARSTAAPDSGSESASELTDGRRPRGVRMPLSAPEFWRGSGDAPISSNSEPFRGRADSTSGCRGVAFRGSALSALLLSLCESCCRVFAVTASNRVSDDLASKKP